MGKACAPPRVASGAHIPAEDMWEGRRAPANICTPGPETNALPERPNPGERNAWAPTSTSAAWAATRAAP